MILRMKMLILLIMIHIDINHISMPVDIILDDNLSERNS
jgi:hypothetical protein